MSAWPSTLSDFSALGEEPRAIGFAFQDIFKNFLAGILLLINEPFRIGDAIVVDALEGVVERIDIRTTNVRAYTGELILIPNSLVFTIVDASDFGESAIDLTLRYWTNSQHPETVRTKTRVALAIETAFDAARIDIPFPIRTSVLAGAERDER